MAKKKPKTTPIKTHKHTDTRPNIPTRQQAAMLSEEHAKPKTLRYPRDDSLDPQLVWAGKDEQDGSALEVPSVPIFIQEKIQPKGIIEEFRDRVKRDPGTADLFADFDGPELDHQERLDFYKHARNWSNRMILGDSLMVMASLADKEKFKGRVQCIYMDPPYGIKFGSNWQVSTRKRDVKDAKVTDLTRQPEQIKAFRDTWELGFIRT